MLKSLLESESCPAVGQPAVQRLFVGRRGHRKEGELEEAADGRSGGTAKIVFY